MNPAESTSFIHDGATMTEYENEPFIVGDYNHNQIEFMHLSHEKWYTASPFPYPSRVFGYAAVSRPGKVYILGGHSSVDGDFIYGYQNHEWEMVGRMKYGRINFMTIAYGTDIMIFGGRYSVEWSAQKRIQKRYVK